MQKGIDYPGVTVVFFCHDGQGNFLLNKRSEQCRDEHGRWDPGGGGIDMGQSVEDTVRREIREEYCTDVLAYEFLGYRNLFREVAGQKSHWIALDFKVLVDRNKVRNGEPHKLAELAWFTLDNLPQPLHSQFPKALRLYEKKLRKQTKRRTY